MSDRAPHDFHGGTGHDPAPDVIQNRPVGARRRPADASAEGRYTDDGRRADSGCGDRHYPFMGRPAEPFRVGCARCYAGFRHHRVGRRLPQSRAPKSQRAVGTREVFLANDGRCDGRMRDCVQHKPAAANRIHRALFQEHRLSAGCHRLHRVDVSRDRRHQQRGESHGRSGRTRHHADGDDCCRARHLCVRRRQRGLREVPSASRTYPARASLRFFAAHWRERVSPSCGSTLIRRKSSWAMSARWRLERRSARSP